MSAPLKTLFQDLARRAAGEWLEVQPAWLGDYTQTVDTGTPGMVYARLINGKVVEAYNQLAPLRFDLPVKIGRSRTLPNIWQVIEVREFWDSPAASGEVPYHAAQHMFGAGDMLPVDRKQIIRLTILVADAAGFIVTVYGGEFPKVDGTIGVVETQNVDLSSYVGGANAYYVSIETDGDGVLSVHTGTDFGAPEAATPAAVPVPDVGKYMIGYVLLYTGMTALLNGHISVPMPLTTNYTSVDTGAQISSAAADTPADGDKLGFWDIVDLALKSLTWGNLKTLLKAYFDPLYTRMAHEHGLMRWNGAAGQTTFDFLDVVAEVESVMLNGLEEDPLVYSLSADGLQLVLDSALASDTNVIAHYVLMATE